MNPRSKTCGMCAGKGKKKKPAKVIDLICEYCGEKFKIPQWRYNQKRGRFCSKDCKDKFLTTIKGEDHIKFTGRNAPTHYSGMSYKKARQAVIERANGKCEKCGIDLSLVKKISIHHDIGLHKFENKDEGNTPDNLSVICQSCHAKLHGLGKVPGRDE